MQIQEPYEFALLHAAHHAQLALAGQLSHHIPLLPLSLPSFTFVNAMVIIIRACAEQVFGRQGLSELPEVPGVLAAAAVRQLHQVWPHASWQHDMLLHAVN